MKAGTAAHYDETSASVNLQSPISNPPMPLQVNRQLLAWTIWADRHQLGALASVPEEHLLVDTGSSFGSLLGTLAHVLGAEQTWLSRFVGTPLPSVPGLETYPTLAALQAGFEEHWPGIEFFLASLSAEQLAAEVTWVNSRGERFTRPLWEPLAHMVTHSAYHRGQVATLLRQLGHEPPSTDLVRYLATRQPPSPPSLPDQ
jgi:uncharacterized damage-inducible protein DinB